MEGIRLRPIIRAFLLSFLIATLALLILPRQSSSSFLLLAQTADTRRGAEGELERGFETPPDSAGPRVWWHWMNGNVTKEGIQKDLEWMKRVGIAGFQNFDASLFTPQVVSRRLTYMTPEWKDAFKFTAEQSASNDEPVG